MKRKTFKFLFINSYIGCLCKCKKSNHQLARHATWPNCKNKELTSVNFNLELLLKEQKSYQLVHNKNVNCLERERERECYCCNKNCYQAMVVNCDIQSLQLQCRLLHSSPALLPPLNSLLAKQFHTNSLIQPSRKRCTVSIIILHDL